MYLHVKDIKLGERYCLINKDTGEEISGVRWADEESGYYEQICKQRDGKPAVILHRLLTEVKRGNIEIRKV